MHFRCTCGFTITDQTDYLPYKAWFLPDEDTDLALDYVMSHVQAFSEARVGRKNHTSRPQGFPTGCSSTHSQTGSATA